MFLYVQACGINLSNFQDFYFAGKHFIVWFNIDKTYNQ
jgi:hypothetical protein